MIIRIGTAILYLFLIFAPDFSFAEEEPHVAIQKLEEGRTEARVSSKEQAKRPSDVGVFSHMENGFMEAVEMVSRAVGKGADGSIKAIQMAGSFLFSPLFKVLDLRGRSGAKQN